MSLTSNSAVIAKIWQDQNLADDYFADCKFPEATLTVYQNGILRTVQGRAFCCFHFDQNDPRMFYAAALSMPGAVVRLLTQPPIDSDGNPQGPPGAVHAIPIRVRRHVIPLLPPPLPTSTPYPTYVLNEDRPTYEEAISFGSVPSAQPNDNHNNYYTELEEAFLHHIAQYFEGHGEIEHGIQIPEEFEDGAFLEAVGPEGQVSLRFPLIEALFSRAARTWPNTPFGVFLKPQTPITPSQHDDPVPTVRLPTVSTTTNNSTRSSSPEFDWQYPDSPQELPRLELPVAFRTLTTSMLELETTNMETTADNTSTASTPLIVPSSPVYAPYSPSLSFDDAVKLEQQELDKVSLLFQSSTKVSNLQGTPSALDYRKEKTSSNSSTDSIHREWYLPFI